MSGARDSNATSPALASWAFGLVALLATACGPADGDVRDFEKTHPGGGVRSRGQEVYRDGQWRMNGRIVFFHKDGRKRAEGEYLDGLEQGHWSEWLEDGTRAEGSYENGQRTGRWTYWHESGQKQEEGHYVDGQREGRWTWWYPTGVRREVNEYAAGKKHGIRIAFDEEGKVERTLCGEFVEGERAGPLPSGFDIEGWLAKE